MKYPISFITLTAFLSFLTPTIVFGASYPASCPAEAQAIVNAVGGCSAIDPGQYSSIYGKCCSVSTIPGSQPSLKPSPEPTPGTSSTLLIVIISIIVWGGLAYFIVWFIRKRKKKKGSTPSVPEKKCPYCKEVIPGDATRCSHCQADLRNWPRRHLVLTVIIAIVSLVLLMGLFS